MLKDIWNDKEYRIILITGVILIILLITVYLFSYGTLATFIQNSMVNLIIEILSILITVILLSRLLERRKNRLNKEKAYNIIQFRYSKMISNLYRSFHLFVTKTQMTESDDIKNNSSHFLKSIEDIKNNIEIVIKDDFFTKKPVGMVYEPISNDVFKNFVEKEIDIFQMPLAMRESYQKELNEFLMMYSVILPDDLRNHLYELNNQMETSPLFMSPYQMGMRPNLDNVQYKPEEFRQHTLEILNTYYKLFSYFSGVEDK